MKPAKYFFSYSRVDSDFAKKLATDLRNAGADVWIDQLDIVPGNAWDVAIQNALNEAGGVLAIISDTSIQSKNVMDEISYAIGQEKRIIPLILESCPIPFRLARLQHVDFTKDYDSALEYLLKAIKASGLVSPQPAVSNKVASASPGKSLRTTILLSAIIIAAAILTIFFLSNKNGTQKKEINQSSMSNEKLPETHDSKTDRQQANDNKGAESTATSEINENERIDLIAPENGGGILVASSDEWKYTIDGQEHMAQISNGVGKEAVYGFKDGRSATFDMFTSFVNATEQFNLKDFELFAGNDDPMGQFKSIGKFQIQNVKLFKTPYQQFKFSPVTAKFLKVRLLSTWGYPYPNIYEFQLFGIIK